MSTLNEELFKKLKHAQKLPQRQAADGHEIEVEVREDEEQSVKLQEIIDLLVAAGYFRARIKGLSSFDKVVGGMTWCIESCNVDVDVDFLFQENSTIGQKIALTEKIVSVLPKMKCPHRIEPHQIQGLDFIHIFPVIQWLVKRSMEFRQEHSAFVRSYALNQFNKDFEVKDKHFDTQIRMLRNIKNVNEIYRPRRYYKRKTAPPTDIESRVQITLLEYDHRGGHQNVITRNEENKDDTFEKQQTEQHFETLLDNLTAVNEESLLYEELNEEEKINLAKHYAILHSELKDGGVQSREEKQLSLIEEQKRIIEENCSKLEITKNSLEEEIRRENELLEEIRLKQIEADKALKEIEEIEAKNPQDMKEVEELVVLNDNLKAQEAQFKEHCKQELGRLQKQIEEAKHAKTPTEDSCELDNRIKEEAETVKGLRLQVAKKNRITASLQRQLDDVPNRAELAQYQRRFLELYNQVAAKHKETKQYYSLYNTLEDTRMYMQKELSLLNSISDSYPDAIQSSIGKEEFLKQFQNIIEGVRHSKSKVDRKLLEEKQKRDELSCTLQGLLDLQRRYVAAIRQLSIECKRYEMALAKRKGLTLSTVSRPT